jgi:selenophosphate synthetase-related protein
MTGGNQQTSKSLFRSPRKECVYADGQACGKARKLVRLGKDLQLLGTLGTVLDLAATLCVSKLLSFDSLPLHSNEGSAWVMLTYWPPPC